MKSISISGENMNFISFIRSFFLPKRFHFEVVAKVHFKKQNSTWMRNGTLI